MPLAKLEAMTLSWGGRFERVTREALQAFEEAELILRQSNAGKGCISVAPFSSTVAINYQEKVIYMTGDATWPHVLHEMGHVFASRTEPGESEEFEFLGWEYAIARRLGGVKAWLKSNEDYGLGDGDDRGLGERPPGQLKKILEGRLRVAIREGLILRGVPVSVR